MSIFDFKYFQGEHRQLNSPQREAEVIINICTTKHSFSTSVFSACTAAWDDNDTIYTFFCYFDQWNKKITMEITILPAMVSFPRKGDLKLIHFLIPLTYLLVIYFPNFPLAAVKITLPAN